MLTSHVEIPRLRTLSRHAGRHFIEATLVPVGLFYAAITLCGQVTALLVALGWCYLAVARRLLTRRRVPGLLALAAVGSPPARSWRWAAAPEATGRLQLQGRSSRPPVRPGPGVRRR